MCTKCNSTGFGQVDRQVVEAGGAPVVIETAFWCDACIEAGICPSCAAPIIVQQEVGTVYCDACGYNSKEVDVFELGD